MPRFGSARAVATASKKSATRKRICAQRHICGARTDLASIEAMSDADAAKLLHVGEATIERAKAVLRTNNTDLIEAVRQSVRMRTIY
jgi:hypothetical protein